MPTWGFIAFGIAMLAGAAFAGVRAIKSFRMALASRHWPIASGTIIDAHIDVSKSSEHGEHYSPSVTYSYKVRGYEYKGRRFSFDDTESMFRSAAEDAIDGFAPGVAVAVYYDPRAPKNCVLQPGPTKGTIGQLLIAIAIALGGATFTLGPLLLD